MLNAAPVFATDRVALVIGNGAYRAISALDNPANDAQDIMAALTELDFAVYGGNDMDRATMSGQIAGFAEAAADSQVALFYYAGHAFQIGGQNYLLPTDLVPTTAQSVLDQAVSLNDVLVALEGAPGLRLVFLDACRDNPLGVETGNGPGGLARVGSAANFMITYATQPGAVAFDGQGRNGTFTEALLSHIHTPGQTLAELMIAVRKDVVAATGGQQIPWESSSLTRQFQFDPRPASVSEETMLYQLAARAGNPELMALYQERFPRGSHIAEVTSFLSNHETLALSQRSLPDPTELQDDGAALWELAKRSQLRPVAESYLALYPQGPHAAEARRMVSTLPTRADLGPAALCRELATHPDDAHGRYAGTSYSFLQRNAIAALSACQAAADAFPEQPQYLALLARTTMAAGREPAAIALYEQAAELGNIRAMESLGYLREIGRGVSKDPVAAVDLYRRAAAGGSLDAMTNLAVALYQGQIVERNEAEALALFRRAAEAGSPEATLNLGQIALSGETLDAETALSHFLRAAELGEPRGYRFAALILDIDTSLGAQPNRAADLLLRGVAEDGGDILTRFEQGADQWSNATIAEMQRGLTTAGYSVGEIDGVIGPKFLAALRAWRNGGFDPSILDPA